MLIGAVLAFYTVAAGLLVGWLLATRGAMAAGGAGLLLFFIVLWALCSLPWASESDGEGVIGGGG